jgi:hypothetical protein
MQKSFRPVPDAARSRRAAYRLVCECGETRTYALATQLFELVDANEYTGHFSDAQWDAIREVAEALWVLATGLAEAYKHPVRRATTGLARALETPAIQE